MLFGFINGKSTGIIETVVTNRQLQVKYFGEQKNKSDKYFAFVVWRRFFFFFFCSIYRYMV